MEYNQNENQNQTQAQNPVPNQNQIQNPVQKQKHSGFGVASFILSIFSGLAIFVVIIIAGVIETNSPGGMSDESAEAVMIGLAILGLMFASVVALGLAIGGLIQKERKKVFAVLGLVFSGVTVLGTVAIIMIGLAVG